MAEVVIEVEGGVAHPLRIDPGIEVCIIDKDGDAEVPIETTEWCHDDLVPYICGGDRE